MLENEYFAYEAYFGPKSTFLDNQITSSSFLELSGNIKQMIK